MPPSAGGGGPTRARAARPPVHSAHTHASPHLPVLDELKGLGTGTAQRRVNPLWGHRAPEQAHALASRRRHASAQAPTAAPGATAARWPGKPGRMIAKEALDGVRREILDRGLGAAAQRQAQAQRQQPPRPCAACRASHAPSRASPFCCPATSPPLSLPPGFARVFVGSFLHQRPTPYVPAVARSVRCRRAGARAAAAAASSCRAS
jgi:hypothetical protein